MKKDFNPTGFFGHTTNMAFHRFFFFYTNNKPSKSHMKTIRKTVFEW